MSLEEKVASLPLSFLASLMDSYARMVRTSVPAQEYARELKQVSREDREKTFKVLDSKKLRTVRSKKSR
jgi:hypothetical protein